MKLIYLYKKNKKAKIDILNDLILYNLIYIIFVNKFLKSAIMPTALL